MRDNLPVSDNPGGSAREDGADQGRNSTDDSSLRVLTKILGGFDGFGMDTLAKLADVLGSYAPSVNVTCCPNTRSRNKPCPAPCTRICPTSAITASDTVVIDKSRCISCNICTTACHHGVFDPTAPPDSAHFDAILAARREGKKVMRFSCDRCGGRYGESRRGRTRGTKTIVLPCLGSLSEVLPMYAMLLDCTAVIDPCAEDCRFKEGRECYDVAVKKSETLLHGLSSPSREAGDDLVNGGAPGLERRAFLLSAGEEMLKILLDVENESASDATPEPYRQLLPRRRRELLALAKRLPLRAGKVDFQSYPILEIQAKEADCDLCEICCKLCPTGALRYDERDDHGSIYFSLGRCTGCKLCLEICPRKCISSSDADLGDLTSDWKRLVRKKLHRCSICNFKFSEGSSYTTNGNCPVCNKKKNLFPS